MPRRPPCVIALCDDPERENTQYYYVPEAYKAAHPEKNLGEDACVCKGANCRREVGLKEPPGVPGRKPKVAKLNDTAVGVALSGSTSIPTGYKLMEPAEIWGVRYAITARSSPACFPRTADLTACHLSSLECLPVRRYADIATMHPDLHEVRLRYAPDATSMEYAVHGRFCKPPVDGIELTNGVWGCFYMSLRQMVRDMNKEEVTNMMLHFENDLAEARAESIDELPDEEEEEEDDD